MQLKKFMNTVWHKYNLIISSSVTSSHPDKYLYEIPHEYFSGRGNLSEKIISINVFLM